MKTVLLSFVYSLFGTVVLLYVLFTHYFKVVDGVKVLKEMETPLLKEMTQGVPPDVLAKRKALMIRAFEMAVKEQKGIVFMSQSVLKSPFRDVTDEVLERTRYWYAYLTAHGVFGGSEGRDKSGQEP